MLKIEKTVTASPDQWEIIIEGMRNPKNSWNRMDSYSSDVVDCETDQIVPHNYFIGKNDMDLAKRLASGGPVHAKYRRMIPVYATIVAPLYWWKEFDTYKVGTVRNSCSTMHKIHVKEFTIDDFSHDAIDEVGESVLETFKNYISTLEALRKLFNDTQEKKYWRAMIQMLPDGFNMKATISTNYEVLHGQRMDRANHKLTEWHQFCAWIDDLPYSELIRIKKTGEPK